jgi:hypothetical protein
MLTGARLPEAENLKPWFKAIWMAGDYDRCARYAEYLEAIGTRA